MYFGFTAGAFADTIFNVGNESIAANLKTFRKLMQQKCPPSNALAFDKTFQELTVRTENRGMQLNDQLKYALESRVFNIPSNILVESDDQHANFQGIEKDELEKNLDKQIQESERKIVSCEYARVKMEQSIAHSQELLAEFENITKELREQNGFAKGLSSGIVEACGNLKETSAALQNC